MAKKSWWVCLQILWDCQWDIQQSMCLEQGESTALVLPLPQRCWDRRQTVNLVSAGGLVEQSNARRTTLLTSWLALLLAGWLAGWLLVLLVAGWPADCWLTGWRLAAAAAAAAAGRLGGCLAVLRLLAGWVAAWLAGCCCSLAACLTAAGWPLLAGWLTPADWPELLWLLPEWLR